MWEGEEPGPQEGGPTPKQRLLNWVQSKVPDVPVRNFNNDWNDGKAIGALVDAIGPGMSYIGIGEIKVRDLLKIVCIDRLPLYIYMFKENKIR